MTDAQAMERLKSGDTEALRVLYDRHRQKIFGLGCRYLRQPEEAEDIVQQVFIKAYEAAPKFRGEARVSTWLYRIAVNACLEVRRRRRTVGIEDLRPAGCDEAVSDGTLVFSDASESTGGSPVMAGADWDANPLVAAERSSTRARLDRALDTLSPSQRLAFVLRHWEGMSIREISEVLGAAEGTVKSHLFRAVRALRVELVDLTP
jgi:RNA polymerase sigma-70 factor (ECF subfamily)